MVTLVPLFVLYTFTTLRLQARFVGDAGLLCLRVLVAEQRGAVAVLGAPRAPLPPRAVPRPRR